MGDQNKRVFRAKTAGRELLDFPDHANRTHVVSFKITTELGRLDRPAFEYLGI